MNEAQERATKIFLPHAMGQLAKLKANPLLKFTHYTSVDAAEKIILGESIWLRNSRKMNDFLEIEQGHKCITSCFNDQTFMSNLERVLDRFEVGLLKKIVSNFGASENERLENTFISSICMHGENDQRESEYGRLSMWRAYGGDTGVALVLNSEPILSESISLPVIVSPVLYADEAQFRAKFMEVVANIDENMALVHSLGPRYVEMMLGLALDYAAMCTKHPGFAEETEWRALNSSRFNYFFQHLEPLESITIGNGKERQAIKIMPLRNNPKNGLNGLAVLDFIKEIIVGPTHSPIAIRDRLIAALEARGDANAEAKIRVSSIPHRRSTDRS